MINLIIAGLLALVAVIAIGVAAYANSELKDARKAGSRESVLEAIRSKRFWSWVSAIVALVVGGVVLAFSVFVSNGVGEAKVFINIDGTVAFTQTEPGFTTKAPWQDYREFDLFSQEVTYAGSNGQAPSYSGGMVNGGEVTVSVGGVNGGSTQANLDISVTYSIDADAVEDIYREYKSQERFTQQVVEKQILATIREVPGRYSAVEFRGEKRAEASDAIFDALTSKLDNKGVQIGFVSIQDIRYPTNVEEALADVEAANQAALKAEALQRQAEVDAETKRIQAQGEADAIAIRNSQSPNEAVLRQLYIEALSKSGTIYVVPEGSSPLVNIK